VAMSFSLCFWWGGGGFPFILYFCTFRRGCSHCTHSCIFILQLWCFISSCGNIKQYHKRLRFHLHA